MTRHYARVLDKSIMRDMTIVNGKFAATTPTRQTSPDPKEPVPVPGLPVKSAEPTIPASVAEIPNFIPYIRSGIVN